MAAWEEWGEVNSHAFKAGQVYIVIRDSPAGWLFKLYGVGGNPNEPFFNLKTKKVETAKRRAKKRGLALIQAKRKKLEAAFRVLKKWDSP